MYHLLYYISKYISVHLYITLKHSYINTVNHCLLPNTWDAYIKNTLQHGVVDSYDNFSTTYHIYNSCETVLLLNYACDINNIIMPLRRGYSCPPFDLDNRQVE